MKNHPYEVVNADGVIRLVNAGTPAQVRAFLTHGTTIEPANGARVVELIGRGVKPETIPPEVKPAPAAMSTPQAAA